MGKFKRSQILINKPFQLRFSLFVCSWIFGLSIIYPVLIYKLYDFFFRYMSADPNGPQIAILKSSRNQMLILLLVLELVFLAVTFLISLYLSHRIAGPLYKLDKYMKLAGQGNLEPVSFRKKDFFKELESGFNEMLLGVRSGSRVPEAVVLEHLQNAMKVLSPSDAAVRSELQKALIALESRETRSREV